ncbi:MAG: ABC transporter permease [Bacillota bacterium]|nr:ABC transporter permease [Bacillota bacterium]
MKGTKSFINNNIREIVLAIVIIVLAVFVNIRSSGAFLTGENIMDTLSETAVMAIISVGMMIVLLTGGIDLSAGAVMGLAGMTATTILKNNHNLNPFTVILIAVIVGVLCGLVNGFLVAKLNIFPIIATLGTMYIFRGLVYVVSPIGRVNPQEMTTPFLNIATKPWFFKINNLVLITIIIYLIAWYLLEYFRAGRRIYVVGNSISSARISGIKASKVLLWVYTIAGALAGLGGILYVGKYSFATGDTGSGFEMNLIAVCVLGGVSVTGGTGKISGVILGAILFGELTRAMPMINISEFWQEAVRGLIIILSVIVNALIQRNVVRKSLERRDEL